MDVSGGAWLCVDYSSTRPNPAQLYAAGKRFVVRYGGPGGSWKHLTAAEAASLTAAGLALVANAEGTADGMLGGWDVGVSWARSAEAAFRALGCPPTDPSTCPSTSTAARTSSGRPACRRCEVRRR